MKSASNWSLIACSLIIGYFFAFKFVDTLSGKSTCVANYDGFGYYMYLPHLIEEGNLFITPEWAQAKQDEYCNGCEAYQLNQQANGNYIDIYQMGLAVVEAPSFFLAHIFAKIGGWKADGFSVPYQLAFIFNAFFFLLLGLFYLRLLLLEFASDIPVALTIPILLFASNAFVTFDSSIALQHLYLFSINTVFCYYTYQFYKTDKKQHLIIAVILFGLGTFIRPTQAILGIIPFFLFQSKFKWKLKFWNLIVLFPAAAFLWNSLHILYWYSVGGKFILLNLHVEEVVLTDPHFIDFIVSYKKGWLMYSPIFLLLIPGFILMYRSMKSIFWAVISLLFIYIWVMSSWENWWYAYSFGSRVMSDIYGILAIPIVFVFQNFRTYSIPLRGLLVGFLILILPNALLQGYQFKKGLIHGERMSKQQFWYLAGNINFTDYKDYRLEMDRNTIEWVDQIQSIGDPEIQIQGKTIFKINHALQCLPEEDLTIGRIKIFDEIPTDEARITVKLKTSNSNSTIPVVLRMEACNKHNVYDWKSWDISSGLDSSNELTFQYNLAHAHHSYDEIQIYLDQAGSQLKLEQFEVVAEYVIRK